MSILSLFLTAGGKQVVNRINPATRIPKLRRCTDIRVNPTSGLVAKAVRTSNL